MIKLYKKSKKQREMIEQESKKINNDDDDIKSKMRKNESKLEDNTDLEATRNSMNSRQLEAKDNESDSEVTENNEAKNLPEL